MRPRLALALALLLAPVSTRAAPPAPAKVVAPPLAQSPIPVAYPEVARTSATTSQLLADVPSQEGRWKATPKTDPKRADVGLKVGLHHVELAMAADADRAAATKDAERTKAAQIRTAALTRAVEVLRAVADEHPTFGRLDEVLYHLARAHRALGSDDLARLIHLELTKKMPLSRFVPWAYLDIGDSTFEQALQGKVDWTIPREAYTRAAKWMGPDGEGLGYAAYKLGFAEWHLGNKSAARKSFTLAKEFAAEHPKVKGAAELAAATAKALAAL